MASRKSREKSTGHADYNHICTLENEEGNLFSKSRYNRFRQFFEVSEANPRTKLYFRSLAAIDKERKHHREMYYGKFMIHPLSKFRIYWEVWQCITIFLGLMVIPVNVIRGPIYPNFQFRDGYGIIPETLELLSDFFYLLDILITFFTGFCVSHKKLILMKPKAVARMYLSSAIFYIDLLCCGSPVLYSKVMFAIRPELRDHIYSHYFRLTAALNALRLCKFLIYWRNETQLFRQLFYLCITLKYTIMIIIAMHWFISTYIIVVQLTAPFDRFNDYYLTTFYIFFDVHDELYRVYNVSFYLVTSYMLNISTVTRYNTSTYSTVDTTLETFIFLIFSTIGFICSNFLLVIFLQMILSLNSSEIKYHSILAQLEQYMRYKDLPNNMKERITSYYEYRFQRKYFRESTILEMLSDTLKRDINLHSCRTLIETVSVLKDLPADIISEVVFNLKQECFLYNDIIIKAGSFGDCMYFICNGTVAVSTPTGREICHLEDGAYFGEIALISKDQKRIANVIAIEICEIYRLDRKHFRNCFPVNSSFYKRIEQIAQERMEKTILLEELHQKYILDKSAKIIEGVSNSTK